METSARKQIIESLVEKASTKQGVYAQTEEALRLFKSCMQDLATGLQTELAGIDKRIAIDYREIGAFEAELKFGGDVLIFTMHSNVFGFDEEHEVHRTPYVRENPLNAYCGMISIHNFLADSFKYQRAHDVGYNIARVFVNRENHFFIEGRRQLGFLYNDLPNAVLNETYVRAIIESAVLYSIEFDLLVPPYDTVKQMSVQQKMAQGGSAQFRTGKRLGFQFGHDDRVRSMPKPE